MKYAGKRSIFITLQEKTLGTWPSSGSYQLQLQTAFTSVLPISVIIILLSYSIDILFHFMSLFLLIHRILFITFHYNLL